MDPTRTTGDAVRLGALWGGAATLAMSGLMLAATAAGISPMPKPIPAAIAAALLGATAPKPLMMGLAMAAHLAYGAAWGAALAALWRPVTVWKGLALGAGLWAAMGVVVLPLLGWGAFGTAVTPRIAAATLALHLVYGGVLGWGLAATPHAPEAPAAAAP